MSDVQDTNLYYSLDQLPDGKPITGNELVEAIQDGENVKFKISDLKGNVGADGKDAYQVAVGNGFQGTRTAWLESLKGAAGATGAAGPKGADGAAGSQGLQGVAGPAGANGGQGPQGLEGPAGPRGPVGPEGVPGVPGVDGEQGAEGLQGSQGPQGIAGPTGPQGVAGIQGGPGVEGAVGPMGPRGLDGPKGADGATGPQGPQGERGPAGPSGGGGGGSLQYWQEGIDPLTEVPLEPGSVDMLKRAAVTLEPIPSVPDNLYDQDTAGVDIVFPPFGIGSFSTAKVFKSHKRDINLSLKEGSDAGYENTSESGHGIFIGGGWNTVAITNPVSYTTKEDNPERWYQDEAIYGASIIGGFSNRAETSLTAIIQSTNVNFTGRDNNGDGILPAYNVAFASESCTLEGYMLSLFGCENISSRNGGAINYTTVLVSQNVEVDTFRSFIAGAVDSGFDGLYYSVLGGYGNFISSCEYIGLFNASGVKGKWQKNVTVIGGKRTAIGSTTHNQFDFETVYEGGNGIIQVKRVTGKSKSGYAQNRPEVPFLLGAAEPMRNGAGEPFLGLYRIRAEIYFAKEQDYVLDVDTQKESIKAYEISYTAMGIGNNLSVLWPTMKVRDLIYGGDWSDNQPFELTHEMTNDGYGYYHLLIFNHLNNDPYDEDSQWVISYRLDITEVLAYNSTDGIDSQIPM